MEFSSMNTAQKPEAASGNLLPIGADGGIYVSEDGAGPAVLLLHGVGLWGDDWLAPARELQDRFRVVRMDTRGHGRSLSPKGPWSLDDFTDDVARVLDRLAIEKTHLAGFSMGGLIAQAFAIRHPDRVGRLALLAATTGRSEDEQRQIESRLSFIRTEHPGTYFREHAAPRWFTEEFRRHSPDVVEACRHVVASNDHESYVKAYEVLVRNDLVADLHRIRHDTLVLTARNDIGAGPKAARLIADEIPNAQTIILPRLKHHILLEAPKVVGGILREFFL
jgi:pimeloyl-ACP methyl ester carboxylesterase